eukprot:6492726-Amphidinium_carterae.9
MTITEANDNSVQDHMSHTEDEVHVIVMTITEANDNSQTHATLTLHGYEQFSAFSHSLASKGS